MIRERSTFPSPNSRLFFSSIDEGERILLAFRHAGVWGLIDAIYEDTYCMYSNFYTALMLRGGLE